VRLESPAVIFAKNRLDNPKDRIHGFELERSGGWPALRIEAKHIERQLEKQMEGVNNLEFNTVVQHFPNFAVSMLKIKLISESDLPHTVDAV